MSEQKTQKKGPLDGIKVLEISQWIAGPGAGAILADFGADVVKVEHPVRGDSWRGFIKTTVHDRKDINFPFEQDNRNKRAITLDLSKVEGQQIAHKVIKNMDVLLTNLRPSELKRYDLEYKKCSAINPKLIWANVTGYGLTGPDCEEPGFDFSAFWARSGFQSLIKEPDRPPVFSRNAMGDHITCLSVFGGIVLALLGRERTGVGQEVVVSLMGTGMWALSYDIMAALSIGSYLPPMKLEDRVAMASNYLTKDNKWIMLWIVQPDPVWSAFCKALEIQDIEKDERFSSYWPRREHNKELRPIIAEALAKRTLDEWKPILSKHGIIFAPVQDPIDLTKDPQAWATERFLTAEHPVYGKFHWVNNPIGLGKTPAYIRHPAPEFSQHTEEYLQEMGITWEEIAKLKDKKIIA